MKFSEFNKKYRNGKKDHVYKACQEAMQIMKNSYDSTHGVEHIENVFELLDLMLSKKNDYKIDFSVLILAVCWHDVYKASNKHGGVIHLLYRHAIEGVASARLFRKQVKRFNLSQKTINQVSYAIRKHAEIQILPRTTAEAKLLDDADKIDSANLERLKDTKIEKIILSKKIYFKFISWHFDRKEARLNYQENKLLFDKYKKELLTYLKAKLK